MKKRMLGIAVLSVLMLSGCSSVKENVKNTFTIVNYSLIHRNEDINSYTAELEQLVEEAEISKDEKYGEYERLKKENKIDENGLYQISETTVEGVEETTEERTGQVYVTFADNNYLKIHYYKDAEHKEEVTGSCYLNPNECIYASVPESNSPNTNLYSFLEYRIYEYSEVGMKQLNWTVTEADMVLQVPMDYMGEEISVVPIGAYRDRELTLQNYYIDEAGNSHSLAGKWVVDKEETTKDSIAISPVVPYILSYEYDSDSYFFVASHPSCRYQSDEDGIVIFDEADVKSEISSYSVELHPYITTEIASDAKWNYKINDGEKVTEKKKAQNISNLKYNDKIVVYTDHATEFQYDESRLTVPMEAQVSDGYTYTFFVKEQNASFYFDPSEYVYSHGSIIFKCRGRELLNGLYLGEGSQITYEVNTVEDGYWLPNGDHTIVVGEAKETKKALNEIKFYPKTQVEVYLTQPKVGGTIRYFIDGIEINIPSVEVYAGTNIDMEFYGWEGWICSAKDHTLYLANEETKQEVSIEGVDVDKIFIENEEHKPNLNLVLDQSIGEKIQIGIAVSDYQETGIVYQKSTFKNTNTLDIGKIGTEDGITISMDNDSVQSGYAIRLITTKTEKNGKQSEETRYVQKLPISENLVLYQKEEIANSAIYYDKVTVTIDRVEVNTYEPKIIDHATINLKYVDTGVLINQGEILDEDREVIVTILPDDGYYVTGTKQVSNDSYQNTMTYKKYLSDIDKIIKDNPVKQIYTVLLDESDSYGNVAYKLDGMPVSGEIKVREGQKISLEYEIIDKNYQIKTEGLLQFIKSKTEGTVTIKVTKDIDGKTIKREEYIAIVKKGE